MSLWLDRLKRSIQGLDDVVPPVATSQRALSLICQNTSRLSPWVGISSLGPQKNYGWGYFFGFFFGLASASCASNSATLFSSFSCSVRAF